MKYSFGGSELDIERFELWTDGELTEVEPQVFDLLRFLAENPDRLVTKEEIFDEVWEGRIVSESALTSRLKSARRAVGDDGSAQRIIKTVRGRGYRLVVPVETTRPELVLSERLPLTSARPIELVGRGDETRRALEVSAQAWAGKRQVAFVVGEAGIGKTTFVRSVIEGVAADGRRTTEGGCLPQTGAAEPYLPFVDALTRLAFADPAARNALQTLAPTWAAQIPELGPTDARGAGEPTERMPREFVALVEHLGREGELVLVLEDFHWADAASTALLERIASRTDPARLLVLVTLRLGEARSKRHGVVTTMSRLTMRHGAHSIALAGFDDEAITAMASARLGGEVTRRSAVRLRSKTGGVPLFVAGVLDAWRADGTLHCEGESWDLADDASETDVVPDTLTELVEQRLEVLDEAERDILDAAAVVGREFAAAGVAELCEQPLDEVEARLERLAAGELFVESRGLDPAPDGSVSAAFRFTHEVYRTVIYDLLPSGRRARLHRKAGERLERGDEESRRRFATDLLHHFENAHDFGRTATYAVASADIALRRYAYSEAMDHVQRGLEAIARLSALSSGADVRRTAYELQMRRAVCSVALLGFRSSDALDAYETARKLAIELGDARAQASVNAKLCRHYIAAARFDVAHEEARRLLETPDAHPTVSIAAKVTLGVASLYLGRFDDCERHTADVISALAPSVARDEALMAGEALEGLVLARTHHAFARWMRGARDEGREELGAILDLARRRGPSRHLEFALQHRCWMLFADGYADGVERGAAELTALCDEYGFRQFRPVADVLTGWCRAKRGEDLEEACRRAKRAANEYEQSGMLIGCTNIAAVEADILRWAGRHDEAIDVLATADELAASTGELWWGPFLAANLAAVFEDAGRPDDARRAREESRRRATEIGAVLP